MSNEQKEKNNDLLKSLTDYFALVVVATAICSVIFSVIYFLK